MSDQVLFAGELSDGKPTIFGQRLCTAIVQAVALYFLAKAAEPAISWPATVPQIFVPSLLIAVFIPLMILFGLGHVRTRPLMLWAGIAGIVLVGLGYYSTTRGDFRDIFRQNALWPSLTLWGLLSVGLFMAHILVVNAIAERRFVASYKGYFESAWKLGIQVFLTLIFIGVFWLVLKAGAQLFDLIHIFYFDDLIGNDWFSYPATALAAVMSIHLTDVKPAIILGIRSLALSLFGWLLPLVAFIILGFLASLPFTSLMQPGKTLGNSDSTVFLSLSGILVLLLNCCYQDGAPFQTTSRIKKIASVAGALELLPLAGLTIWAIVLRVTQYGWSVERIFGVALCIVSCCYAVGYPFAVLNPVAARKRVEITNLIASYVAIALILSLSSPLADPSRIMVADQVARLNAGLISPDKFSYDLLATDGARWGRRALTQLSGATGSPGAEIIASKAKMALDNYSKQLYGTPASPPPSFEAVLTKMPVYPAGRKLPASFFDSMSGPLSGKEKLLCLQLVTFQCEARYVLLAPGEPESLFITDGDYIYVFQQNNTGKWKENGRAEVAEDSQNVINGLFTLAPYPWPDIVVGQNHYTIYSTVP